MNFPFITKGHVTISLISNNQIILDRDNEIMIDAAKIVTARLANILSSNIDYIKVYNDGLLKSSKAIIQREQVATNEVQYVVIFAETDFSGDFDEVQLWCDALGPFARLVGFATQNKPNNEQLSITWKIKILPCS